MSNSSESMVIYESKNLKNIFEEEHNDNWFNILSTYGCEFDSILARSKGGEGKKVLSKSRNGILVTPQLSEG